MPPIYVQVNSVQKEIKDINISTSGVIKSADTGLAKIGGVNKEVYKKAISSFTEAFNSGALICAVAYSAYTYMYGGDSNYYGKFNENLYCIKYTVEDDGAYGKFIDVKHIGEDLNNRISIDRLTGTHHMFLFCDTATNAELLTTYIKNTFTKIDGYDASDRAYSKRTINYVKNNGLAQGQSLVIEWEEVANNNYYEFLPGETDEYKDKYVVSVQYSSAFEAQADQDAEKGDDNHSSNTPRYLDHFTFS